MSFILVLRRDFDPFYSIMVHHFECHFASWYSFI